jgi:hypothetical protein
VVVDRLVSYRQSEELSAFYATLSRALQCRLARRVTRYRYRCSRQSLVAVDLILVVLDAVESVVFD